MYIVVTAGFIVVDFVSGVVKFLMKKTFKSSIMRQGLYHKGAYVLAIAMALLCDYGQSYLDLGFAIPITKSTCVYICITELGSFLENICIINPSLKEWAMKLAKKDGA